MTWTIGRGGDDQRIEAETGTTNSGNAGSLWSLLGCRCSPAWDRNLIGGVTTRLPSGEGCTRLRENNKCSKKLASPVKFGLTAFFVDSINQQQEMKRFFPIFAVAALLLILLFVVHQCGQTNAAKYQTTTITRGPLTEVVTATGTLNPVVNVQVGSQVSGNIQKLFVDFNSKVKAGDIVAQIDPVLFQATVTQAEGDLASAQAALELTKVNATRTQEYLAKKNSSQADVDQAMANLHQAEANVKIKQGALDKAKADLDHCTITSPVDGEVISRSVDVGQTVAASLQAPVIFTIANDLTKMQIDANVAEADVGVVAVNQTVDFSVDAFPNRTFH